jgi:deoxyribose-phosphate aldolase
MDAVDTPPAPRELATYDDLAQMIDYALVGPALSEEQVSEGCDHARDWRVACVTVRPADVQLVSKWLSGSGVRVGSVVSFPHGADTTTAKIYVLRDLLDRGVTEVETVINIGKLVSRQFQYIEMELAQMAEECHNRGAMLKVTLENQFLALDHKVIGYKIVRRAAVDYGRAASVFNRAGYRLDDLELMKKKFGGLVKLDAGFGAKSLDDAKILYTLGCERLAVTDPAPLLSAWKAELRAKAEAAPAPAPIT